MDSSPNLDSLVILQESLGYQFQNPSLLVLSLTHRSYAVEVAAKPQNNQRLEFLGDAVLQLILSEIMYQRFPDVEEGPLTKGRAQLVNRKSLAAQAAQLNLGHHLLLSKGEELHGGRQRQSILADTFEAVVGAIFTDGGYSAASSFISRRFLQSLTGLGAVPSIENPKGELQEQLQSRFNTGPIYRIESMSGPAHERQFVCSVWHRDRELGRGQGASKQAAQTQAAVMALAALASEAAIGAEPSTEPEEQDDSSKALSQSEPPPHTRVETIPNHSPDP